MSIDTDQDRFARLGYLVASADADAGRILAVVDDASGIDGLLDDIVNAPQRQGMIEDAGRQLSNASQGTVASQHQAQDELPQPGLGDRQGEEDLLVRHGRGERGVDASPGAVEWLVDELTTDLMIGGDARDGPATQSSRGDSLASVGRQEPSRDGRGLDGG